MNNAIKKNSKCKSCGLKEIMTDDYRKKISERVKGENNPMFGKFGELNPFFGKKHTKETKDKISNTKKGVKNTSISKPVFCLTNGEIYDSQKEAAENLNLNQRHISAVCLGKRKTHGGYKFIFLIDYEEQNKDTDI
jgi:hypothetical protein